MEKKMIIAVIDGHDSEDTVEALNKAGFYVTVLNTTGGFMRRKNATLLIGTQQSLVKTALNVIKEHAGHRSETVYTTASVSGGSGRMPVMGMMHAHPVERDVGGAAVFVLDLEQLEKF
jgi:uncharacterized protein YaaQ